MGKGNPNRTDRNPSATPLPPADDFDVDGGDSQSSTYDALANWRINEEDTAKAGAVEETRTHLQLVPDLKEEPITVAPEDAAVQTEIPEKGNEKRPDAPEKEEISEPDGNKRPVKEGRKQDVRQSPAELLAQLIKTVEEIDNMDKLEDFAKYCKQKELLMGWATEKGWGLKPLEGSANSKTLVEAIFKRKNELIDNARKEREQAQKEKNLAGQLRKIEGFDDINELKRHFQALKHFEKIKIGANGEAIAIPEVFGSKEMAEALNKQGEKIIEADNKQIEIFDDMDELRKHVETLANFGQIKIGANGEPIAIPGLFGSKEIVETLNKQRGKILAADKEKKSMIDILEQFGKR